MTEVNVQNVFASTPAELRNAIPGDPLKSLEREKRLDGIMGIGSTLDIIQICKPFEFKRKLVIMRRPRTSFKGITELSMFNDILEISLGFSRSFELSLILCSNGQDPKYAMIVSKVHMCINEAILRLGYKSKTKRWYVSTGYDSRIVHSSDWKVFSENLDTALRREFGNIETFNTENPFLLAEKEQEELRNKQASHTYSCKYYFVVKRMGQDLLLDDNLQSEPYKKIAYKYSELNTRSKFLLSIVIHIAIDIFGEDGQFPMWNIEAIKTKLGNPNNIYHVFFLPGVGNMTYNFTQLEDIEKSTKFVQFYSRLGHQLHRNDTTCFKEIFVTPRLAAAQALQLNQNKAVQRNEAEQSKRDVLRLRKYLHCVDALIDQTKLRTAARCEIVNEHRYGPELGRRGEEFKVVLPLAVQLAEFHVELNKLVEPENVILLPSSSLHSWLERMLIPCKNTLMTHTNSVLQMLESLSANGETEKQSLTIRSPADYLDVLVSEAITTIFIRGQLSNKWPVYLETDLDLSSVKFAKRGETCQVRHIELVNNSIKCNLPAINISTHLVKWQCKKNQPGCTRLLNCFDKFKSLSRKSETEVLGDAVSNICKELFYLLYAITISNASDSDTNYVDLTRLKKYATEKELQTDIHSVDEFVQFITISEPNPDKSLNILLASISTILDAKLEDTDGNLGSYLKMIITEAMKKQIVPLYFPKNTSHIMAVLPRELYSDTINKLYEDVFKWIKGREIGKQNLHCSSILRSTLPIYLADNKYNTNTHTFYLPFQNYFDAIEFCLDNAPGELLKNIVKPRILDCSIFNAFNECGRSYQI